MLTELFTFFKENGNGIMYIMFFFIVILFTFSYLNTPADGGSVQINNDFVFNYGRNIVYSIFFIIILLFLFSLLGYNFNINTSADNASSSIYNSKTFRFFNENGLSILNVVILFLMLLVMFSMLGVNFNSPKNKTIKKVVEIESFACNKSDFIANEKQCNTLTKNNCITTSCCGWLNDEKCVSSDTNHKNPNYLSDTTGKPIKVAKWCTNESENCN
jgi:hypothetical protein